MNVHFKITGSLLQHIQTDLARPHSYAAERVGFLFARQGTIDQKNILLLAAEYVPLSDNLYIDDPSVGARINSTAIRNVLQKVIDTGMSAMHVHVHSFSELPQFSKTDSNSLGRLIPSFHHVKPQVPHGAIILGHTGITGRIWITKDTTVVISKYSIIGYPCHFYRR